MVMLDEYVQRSNEQEIVNVLGIVTNYVSKNKKNLNHQTPIIHLMNHRMLTSCGDLQLSLINVRNENGYALSKSLKTLPCYSTRKIRKAWHQLMACESLNTLGHRKRTFGTGKMVLTLKHLLLCVMSRFILQYPHGGSQLSFGST